MRRLISVLCLAALLAPAAAANASPAERDITGVDSIQLALASYLRHDGPGLPTMYFGGAISFHPSDTFGFAGRGPCHRRQHNGHTSMTCHASAAGVPIAPPFYYMDPLLQRAHVEFDDHGWHQTMDWQSEDLPKISYAGNGKRNAAYASSDADSSGRLFSHGYAERKDDVISFLVEALWANVSVDGAHVRMSPDGTVHVTATFPVGQD